MGVFRLFCKKVSGTIRVGHFGKQEVLGSFLVGIFFNIAIILKMFNGNKLIQNVHASEINNDVFKFSTKIISLTEINDKLFWDGSSTCPPDKKSLRRAGCNTRWNVGLLAAVIRGGMAAVFQGLHFIEMQLVAA